MVKRVPKKLESLLLNFGITDWLRLTISDCKKEVRILMLDIQIGNQRLYGGCSLMMGIESSK